MESILPLGRDLWPGGQEARNELAPASGAQRGVETRAPTGRGHSARGAGLHEPPGPALGSLPELLFLAPPCLPQYEIK